MYIHFAKVSVHTHTPWILATTMFVINICEFKSSSYPHVTWKFYDYFFTTWGSDTSIWNLIKNTHILLPRNLNNLPTYMNYMRDGMVPMGAPCNNLT